MYLRVGQKICYRTTWENESIRESTIVILEKVNRGYFSGESVQEIEIGNNLPYDAVMKMDDGRWVYSYQLVK